MTARVSVDVSADLGEGFPNDTALLDLVTSASIACGMHAGDRATMVATMREAAQRGVAIGAHPSYRDRAGFGRREIGATPAAIAADVAEQVELAAAAALDAGARIRFVKPHGALYTRVQHDAEAAAAVFDGIDRVLPGLPVYAMPHGCIPRLHPARVIAEGFPDRGYAPDRSLLHRGVSGAVIDDPASAGARAVSLARGEGVDAADGTRVVFRLQSLCVHGDEPAAVRSASAIRRALADAGVAVAAAVP
ncbi:MAG: 5-oxoprolinase subunit PxpA [Microbacterium sp.]|nr:5-oxoprolinase subunit PxpA [Microbacterium sp.]